MYFTGPLIVTLALSGVTTADNEPSTAQADKNIEVLVVTATREVKPKSELTESVSIFDQSLIERIAPAHPSELLNRAAGVHINNLGGEGHMTSIRQPISTTGVYLFLEDGIPTRPTGFFNHNGLYEINMAQSSMIEVTKGPGSALYGSDAIGGIINSLTPPAPESTELSAGLEVGGNGWRRVLLSGGGALNDNHRLGVQLNHTTSDGYQQGADYERLSLVARLDSDWNERLSSKTVMSYTEVEQNGSSAISAEDYYNHPRSNYFRGKIGGRDVESLRISSEVTYDLDQRRRIMVTPFIRHNTMDLMPPWMVTFDPNIQSNEFSSIGVLTQYRQFFAQASEVRVGVDIDRSDSDYIEHRVLMDRDEQGIWRSFTLSDRTNYDFDAVQTSVSPYLHAEHALGAWRLTGGLRYDYFEIDYTDNLPDSVPQSGMFPGLPFPSTHLRPESQQVTFSRATPKLGAIYSIASNQEVYLSYRQAFRAPTVGMLFRSGASADTQNLAPVTAENYELGWRYRGASYNAEVALYDLQVKNDLVSIIDQEAQTRRVLNAGETQHQGIEGAIDWTFSDQWSASLAYTYTRQRYIDFAYICGEQTCNYSGHEIPRAPRHIGFASVLWEPRWLSGFSAELEGQYLGAYYSDETNTQSYNGHELFNLRLGYAISPALRVQLRVENLTDRRYSTHTANQVGSADIEYRPGASRQAVLMLRWDLL